MTSSEARKIAPDGRTVGVVETQFFTFASPETGMNLESGKKLGPVTLAYETYGTLNPERTNAILVCHALSGDAHGAGIHHGQDNPGWWDDMIGPGKAFDTDRYFVISSNVIGGCKGSTGPSSPIPERKGPMPSTFPSSPSPTWSRPSAISSIT